MFDLNQTEILFAPLTTQTSLRFVFDKYGRDLVLLFHEITRTWIGHDVYRTIFITTGIGKASVGAENYRKAMLKNRSEIIKHQEKVMHVAVGIMPN